MKLLDFIPVRLSLLLIFGILVGDTLCVDPFLPLALSCGAFVLLGYLFMRKPKRNSIIFGLVISIVVLSLGVFITVQSKPENHYRHYTRFPFKGEHLWHLKIKKIIRSTAFSTRYYAEIRGLDESKPTGKILLSIGTESGFNRLHIDEEILVYGTVQKLRKPLNPHQFDYKKYLQREGIYHRLLPEPASWCKLEHHSRTLGGISARLRHSIIKKFSAAGFGESELPVIQALLLGDRMEVAEETYDNYKASGGIHLLAVSGLHIGVLLLLLQFFLKPLELLPRGKILKLGFIVLFLWFFALLAGLSSSVIRAVTMFSFVAYAQYLNRPSNVFNTLALSVLFLLLVFDPLLLFKVGFQLSYAAVISIVSLYPRMMRFWLPKNIVLRKVWELTAVSISAQLGVLPLSLFYFHQFPGLFLITNLVLVPFLGLILGFGIALVILALSGWLPNSLVMAYDFLIRAMNEVVAWVAARETFVFSDIPFDSFQLFFGYLLIFFFVHFLTRVNFKNSAAVLTVILLLQGWVLLKKYRILKTENVLLLHQVKNTVIFHQNGAKLVVYCRDPGRAEKLVSNYRTSQRVREVNFKELKLSYLYGTKTIVVSDGLAIPPPEGLKADLLVLTQSSKIHLDRYLDALDPEIVIADGSNYQSFVRRWQKTCEKRKLPFHYTGEKGAFYFIPGQ